MSSTDPDRSGRSDSDRAVRLQGTDLLRGTLVIVAAVAIGLFVVTRGLDESSTTAAGDEEAAAADSDTTQPSSNTVADPDVSQADSGGSTAAAETTTTTTVAATTTTTAPPAVLTPAEVKVLVLNGAERRGIAQAGSEKLMAAGYVTGVPKNANARRPSAVYYVGDRQMEATAVAEALGVDPGAVVQPYDTANPPIDDLQDAVVVVVIGEDDVIAV